MKIWEWEVTELWLFALARYCVVNTSHTHTSNFKVSIWCHLPRSWEKLCEARSAQVQGSQLQDSGHVLANPLVPELPVSWSQASLWLHHSKPLPPLPPFPLIPKQVWLLRTCSDQLPTWLSQSLFPKDSTCDMRKGKLGSLLLRVENENPLFFLLNSLTITSSWFPHESQNIS